MDPLGGPSIAGPLKSTVDLFINFGTEFFAFIVVAAVIAAFAFYFGHDRLMPLIAAIYTAALIYPVFPFKSIIGDNVYLNLGLFAVLVFAGLVAFSGMAYFIASGSIGFVSLAALSILTAGLLIAIGIHMLPVEQVYTFSAPTKALFVGDKMYFYWLVAPLAGLFFFGRG